jgi:hypothetical protein
MVFIFICVIIFMIFIFKKFAYLIYRVYKLNLYELSLINFKLFTYLPTVFESLIKRVILKNSFIQYFNITIYPMDLFQNWLYC